MHEDVIVDEIAGMVRHVKRDPDLPLDRDTSITSLGVDSLDFVELLFMIEEKFGVDIPFNANADGTFPFATVGSAADEVRSLISAKEAAA